LKFALLRERKLTGDKRVLFSPSQLANIIKKYPQHEFVVESSPTRCFSDQSYLDAGIKVSQHIENCEVFLGIKEVPLASLISGKTYFFFSHTTKKQTHNKEYLRGLKNKNITFYDYENFTNTNHRRLVAFGKSAGQIGAYHALRTYGLKHQLYKLPNPYQCDTIEELHFFASSINLPPIKIAVTGTGNVGKGVSQFLTHLGIEKITPHDFLKNTQPSAVYTQLSKKDYLSHKKTGDFAIKDFKQHPSRYTSEFLKYAKKASILITGHYYHKGMPLFFTPKEATLPDFNINTIADISCDISAPLPTCLRVATQKKPIYGYHKQTGKEADFLNQESIAVMAVDNLPGELPVSSSIDFGTQFSTQILPYITPNFEHPRLQKACVLQQGVFTKKYEYLNDFLYNEKYYFSE